MAEADERQAMARTVKVLTEIAGVAPRRLAHAIDAFVQHAPPAGRERRLPLRQRQLSDDLPFFVDVLGKRHLVLPYSFDTNDMHYHQGFHRFVTARDFADYTTDAFDTLWAEEASASKMMSIGLILRMIGRARPHFSR